MARILLSDVSADRERWLAARKGKIGGSQAYDAADIDEGANPLAVWLELMDKALERDDNERMYYGRQLEQFVCEEFCRQYVNDHPGAEVKMHNPDSLFQHDTLDWMTATPDRLVTIDGEICVLQAKTTHERLLDQWEDGGCPNRVRAQVLHELAVMGPTFYRAYAAVFVLKPTFRYCEIPHEAEYTKALIEREHAHTWKYFLDRTPPPIKDLTSEQVKALFWEAETDLLDLSHSSALPGLIEEYCTAGETEKAAEYIKKRASTGILALCGKAKRVICDKHKIAVIRAEKRELNTSELREQDPELYDKLLEQYPRSSSYMYARITSPKPEAGKNGAVPSEDSH